MEVLQLEVCSNCCESVFVCDDRDESTAFYELIRDEPVTMVSSVLERIFNLSYLKLVNGRCKEVLQQEWLENIPLCRSCLNILIQLNTSFEEFVRVRNLESYISRQIQRVHEVITASLISVSDRTEVEDFDHHFDDCGDEDGIDDIKVDPLEHLGEFEDQQPKVVLQGPWVVLKRLKSDLIPCENRSQTGIVVKSEAADAYEDNFEDNVEFSEAESNHLEGDTTPVKISEGKPDQENQFENKIKTHRSLKQGVRRKKVESQFSKSEKEKRKVSKEGKGKSAIERSSRHRSVKICQKSRSCKSTTTAPLPYPEGIAEFYRRKLVHPFPCVYCELDFDTECARIEHLQETRCVKAKVLCGPCGRVFCNQESRNKHKPTCGKIPSNIHLPPFDCKECGKNFKNWPILKRHGLVHKNDRPFSCDECKYTAKYNGCITLHKEKMHGNMEYFQCTECPQKLKGKVNFDAHLKRMHTEEGNQKYLEQLRKTSEMAKEKIRQKRAGLTSFCSQCNVDFETVDRFIAHNTRKHVTERKFVCEHCGNRYTTSDILKKHIDNCHTDVRAFVCDQCGNRFKTTEKLSGHIRRSHTEEGRLKYNEYNRRKYWKKKGLKLISILSRDLNTQPAVSKTPSGSNSLKDSSVT